MKVDKFIDGKYHATTGEYQLSKALETIENQESLTNDQKATYEFLFKQAFELGYQAAKEHSQNELKEELQKISTMSSEQLKTYFELFDALVTATHCYGELKEK